MRIRCLTRVQSRCSSSGPSCDEAMQDVRQLTEYREVTEDAKHHAVSSSKSAP